MDDEFFKFYEVYFLLLDALLEYIDSRLDFLESSVAQLEELTFSRYNVFVLRPDEFRDS